LGERLVTLAGFEAAKLAAGIVMLSQYTPLLFMGEEYGEEAPFLFFTDFSDKALGKRVKAGRKKELKQNGWKGEPFDPQNPASFECSKINWENRSRGNGRKMLKYYQLLLGLRKAFINNYPNKRLRIKFHVSKDESLLAKKKAIMGSPAAEGCIGKFWIPRILLGQVRALDCQRQQAWVTGIQSVH
jgi:maltooligosyltrehalose trehalohydrolase